MRQIKFRVMDLDGKWHYFTIGDFVCRTPIPAQLNPETWTQFTGLLDANGVEIYEGDILKDNSISKDRYEFGEFVYGVIEFVKSGFCEVYRHSDGRVYHEDIDGVHYVVVGNIYQNPELLK